MKITLSIIKADIGSIGGHIAPSQRLLETVRQRSATRAADSSSTAPSATPATISRFS